MIDLGTDCVVVVRQFVRSELQFLSSACDDGVYSFVGFTEGTKLVTETRRPISLFNFYLTGQGSEIVNVFGTFIFFDCKQLNVKNLLVCLLQERHKELACPQNLRFETAVKEASVVDHALGCLVVSYLFLGLIRQWGNNSLRVRSEQILAQSFKVRI